MQNSGSKWHLAQTLNAVAAAWFSPMRLIVGLGWVSESRRGKLQRWDEGDGMKAMG